MAAGALALLLLAGCNPESREADTASVAQPSQVVVYTALDQIFSEPLLQKFEEDTGITVQAVYDTESAKTVGLVNRLLAEKARPRADVFWNNEIIRTLMLKREGITQPYASPQADAFPAAFRDPEHHWTGFAARARVIIYNTKLVPQDDTPDHLEYLIDPRWKGQCAIANPLFGTTATHAAIGWWLWGPECAQTFFRELELNNVVQMPGNATVRDQVALGEMAWGFTDTDDANGALLDGRPVGITYPLHKDPHSDNEGIVLIPNTVSLIRDCPHPEAGRKLIDYLLSPEVEKALAAGRSAQLPLRPGLEPPPGWEAMEQLPKLKIDWDAVLEALEPSARWLDEHYVR